MPTELNPSDDAGRGIAPSELTTDHRCFNGPNFLTLVPDQWPPSPINTPEPEDDTEIRSPLNIFATVITSDRVDPSRIRFEAQAGHSRDRLRYNPAKRTPEDLLLAE